MIKLAHTTNHRFPVETGRWQGKPLGDRFCTLCNDSQTEEEFHYILESDTISTLHIFCANTIVKGLMFLNSLS